MKREKKNSTSYVFTYGERMQNVCNLVEYMPNGRNLTYFVQIFVYIFFRRMISTFNHRVSHIRLLMVENKEKTAYILCECTSGAIDLLCIYTRH